jgi:hypothetical protein
MQINPDARRSSTQDKGWVAKDRRLEAMNIAQYYGIANLPHLLVKYAVTSAGAITIVDVGDPTGILLAVGLRTKIVIFHNDRHVIGVFAVFQLVFNFFGYQCTVHGESACAGCESDDCN